MALAVLLVRDGAAVTAPRLLGVPAQVVDGHAQFALGLRQGLAVLADDDLGAFVRAGLEGVDDLVDVIGAGHARESAPAIEGRLRVLQRLLHAGAVHGGLFREGLAGRRVDHVNRVAGLDKLAVQIKGMDFHSIVQPGPPSLRFGAPGRPECMERNT